MHSMNSSRKLYDELNSSRPDLLELLNEALFEAYNAGNNDGYHTSTGNQSGILAAIGGLRDASNYQLLFPPPSEQIPLEIPSEQSPDGGDRQRDTAGPENTSQA